MRPDDPQAPPAPSAPTARPDAHEVAAAWARELPGVPTRSVPVVTAAKLLAAALRRRRESVLYELGTDAATLDLLSTLRRAGPPYRLTTRELADRCLVTAGAISQRVARAERDGLVERRAGAGRTVEVALAPAGHARVETLARSVLEADDELVAGLDDETLVQLEDVLDRWRRHAEGRAPAPRGSASPAS
ncbi:MarR family transcriptional regulator [Cellulomonas sp.]|uniref:MarR family winged helix-turn-helix transcriptional regulator n=1 Tax=Cellulomonas sp. TaxID=40001 RepID=UPI0028118C05|nr:MarR family transcriptional regulator [Cellulomonas sp.]